MSAHVEARVESSRVGSSRVESSRVESSQVESSRVERRVESSVQVGAGGGREGARGERGVCKAPLSQLLMHTTHAPHTAHKFFYTLGYGPSNLGLLSSPCSMPLVCSLESVRTLTNLSTSCTLQKQKRNHVFALQLRPSVLVLHNVPPAPAFQDVVIIGGQEVVLLRS